MNDNLKTILDTLPLTSGVYLMKDADGTIIYVGKAVSIRKRVRSYFTRARHKDPKTSVLVSRIRDIDFIETESEAEALLLEASLIKQHQPRYNITLTDDKSYPYIEMTDHPFPKVSIVRPREKDPNATYFGPYVNAGLIREALKIIRRIFPFRTCEPFPDKECLDYHIGLCAAPCIGRMSEEQYARNIQNVRLILEGKKDELYRRLQEQMEALARERNFEEAARARDQLQAIGALYSGTKDVNYFKEAEQIQRALGLPHAPRRIETFDISNIMGNQAVGSMVSFFNGIPDKNQYRRFRIKDVEGIDDFKMIAEVVRRRYGRLKREGLPYPDLIVIDGGKGQLGAAVEQLEQLDVKIPILSLAKREEEVFVPGRRSAIRLSADSLGLKLLMRARDEAHRFALAYHRKLRSKDAAGSGSRRKSNRASLSPRAD